MAKNKEAEVRDKKVNWAKEARLAPGYIILLIWILFTFLLIGWVVAASLVQTKEVFSGNTLSFPTGIHFENYVKAWTTSEVYVFFTNSLVYASISCVILILICAPAAYVLSRFEFIGNKIIQSGFVSAMGVPIVMIVLPLFGIITNMGLIDQGLKNRIVLVFLYVGINIPYTTIFLMTFFRNISHAYEEAAAIDGCTPIKTFWKIMFPMAQSGIITVTIFNFINVWNEYFISLIFANSDKIKSVAVGLYGMIASMRYTGDYAGMFAAVVIVFLPTFLLYIVLSEKIIAGITGGGVKG